MYGVYSVGALDVGPEDGVGTEYRVSYSIYCIVHMSIVN